MVGITRSMESWFLLQTKSKQESRAVENLERQGCQFILSDDSCRKSSLEARGWSSRKRYFPATLSSILIRSQSLQPLFARREVSVTLSPAPVRQSRCQRSLINQLMLRTDPAMRDGLSLPRKGDSATDVDGPFRGLKCRIFSARWRSASYSINQSIESTGVASLPFAVWWLRGTSRMIIFL